MRKTRIIVWVAAGLLVVLMIIGIVFLILDENTNPQGTTYEIIAFVVGMAGMLMAVFSEIDATRQERKNNQIAREIRELVEDEIEDTELLKKILKKLDGKNSKK